MQVGIHLGYQNLHGRPDVETFMQETKFAIEAEAMGFDLGAIHAADRPKRVKAVKADLFARRPRHWLDHAASTAVEAVLKDFEEWTRLHKKRQRRA